jgi:AcrR family transcriptional regulator
MTGRETEKKRQILEAATRLLSRYGYRRTSVDLIAAEADVAKGTLYAYFADKEAVFRAVCEHVCALYLERAQAAVRRAAPIEERVFGLLDAKFGYFFELVRNSPHAPDLFDAQSRLAADIVVQASAAYHRLLTETLAAAQSAGELDLTRAGLQPDEAATVLMQCAQGAAAGADSTATHTLHLRRIVRTLFAGLSAPPSAGP